MRHPGTWRQSRRMVRTQEVLEGQVYDFEEPERIDKGLAPVTFQEDVQLVGSNSSSSSWDVEALLMCR